MDHKSEAEESAWPEMRKALMEGLTAVLKDPQSSAYLMAKSEARLCGVREQAKNDERWKAMAMMRALSSGAGLWSSIAVLEEAGESWEKVGPLVFKEWLFLIEESSRRSNPFLPSQTDISSGNNMATTWVWLAYAMSVSQVGWASFGQNGPEASDARSPLGDTEQAELAKVFLSLREAAIASEKKHQGSGRSGFQRAFQSLFQNRNQPYWKNEDEAVGYFEAMLEKSRLLEETPPGVKRVIGRRM